MAVTWPELCAALSGFGTREGDILRIDFPLGESYGSTPAVARQTVFVAHAPGETGGMIQVSSPIGKFTHAELATLLQEAGQLTIGGLGYSPLGDEAGQPVGVVIVYNMFPLELLHAADAGSLAIHLTMFGRVVNTWAQRYGKQL